MIHSKSFKATSQPLLEPSASKASPPFGFKILQQSLQRFQSLRLRHKLLFAVLLLGSALSLQAQHLPSFEYHAVSNAVYPPLAMVGGDPHVRALMRTISVSESNDANPYGLLGRAILEQMKLVQG